MYFIAKFLQHLTVLYLENDTKLYFPKIYFLNFKTPPNNGNNAIRCYYRHYCLLPDGKQMLNFL